MYKENVSCPCWTTRKDLLSCISAKINHWGNWIGIGINVLHPCSSWCTCANQGVSTRDPEISTVERSPKLPPVPPPAGRDQQGYHTGLNSIAIFRMLPPTSLSASHRYFTEDVMNLEWIEDVWSLLLDDWKKPASGLKIFRMIFRLRGYLSSGCGKRGVLRRVSPTLRSQTLPADPQGRHISLI